MAATVVPAFRLIYGVVLRSWHQSWGRTEAEIHGILPGDDLIAGTGQVTWLIEIGQDRSGFSSYTFLENRIGAAMPKVERLVPE